MAFVPKGNHDYIKRMVAEFETEITQLKADLGKFAECALKKIYTNDLACFAARCDCGFTKAEERWK